MAQQVIEHTMTSAADPEAIFALLAERLIEPLIGSVVKQRGAQAAAPGARA